MSVYSNKTEENRSQSIVHTIPEKQLGNPATLQFIDNRPETVTQMKFQEMANTNVIQRNAYVSQNYAPPIGRVFEAGFRDQHTPAEYGFSDEAAINIHEIRGAIPFNTLINITEMDAIYDIQNELLGLSDQESDDLINRERIWITTSGSYDYIETGLNEEGMPYVRRRGNDCMNVRLQWMARGYYQMYHFGQVGAW